MQVDLVGFLIAARTLGFVRPETEASRFPGWVRRALLSRMKLMLLLGRMLLGLLVRLLI